MSTILVLHGPNLNMLGTREPEVYGHETLADIDDRLRSKAAEKGHHLLHLQSNAEYELIERVHEARAEGVDFIIINPAAFTHTAWPFGMPCWRRAFPLLKCIFQTCMRGNLSAITLIFQISPKALSAGWAARATISP